MTGLCLIVIDMLYDFLDAWEADRRARLIERTNRLIGVFRSAALPVIWIRQEFKADLSDGFLEMRDKGISVTIEGTRGAEIHRDLGYRSSDRTIVKKRYSAFFGTNLDEVLNEIGATWIVLAGLNTHACIRMAAIDAYQRDFRVVLAAECIESHDDAHARISLSYMAGKIASLMTTAQIVEALKRASAPRPGV